MYKYTYEKKFNFIYGEKTFVPTTTSEILLENIFADNQKLGSTLDLGTGIGFVIIMLKLKGAEIIDYDLSNFDLFSLIKAGVSIFSPCSAFLFALFI